MRARRRRFAETPRPRPPGARLPSRRGHGLGDDQHVDQRLGCSRRGGEAVSAAADDRARTARRRLEPAEAQDRSARVSRRRGKRTVDGSPVRARRSDRRTAGRGRASRYLSNARRPRRHVSCRGGVLAVAARGQPRWPPETTSPRKEISPSPGIASIRRQQVSFEMIRRRAGARVARRSPWRPTARPAASRSDPDRASRCRPRRRAASGACVAPNTASTLRTWCRDALRHHAAVRPVNSVRRGPHARHEAAVPQDGRRRVVTRALEAENDHERPRLPTPQLDGLTARKMVLSPRRTRNSTLLPLPPARSALV